MNIIRKILAAALVWAALASPALAQSSPGWTYGYVPTPAQWNAAFAGKQDFVGAAFLPLSGGTMTGRLTTSTPNSSGAGFTLPQGADPSSPNNGDLWTTSAGLKARVNGSTYNLTGGGFPIVVGTTTITGGTSGAPLSNSAGVLANGLVASTWSTFQQIGTGSGVQTVQTKLARWFDVKDFQATGDGITDDAPFIRAAIAALNAAGGGLLVFPCTPGGSYRVASFEPGTPASGGSIFNFFGNTTFSFCGSGGKIVVGNNMNTASQQFFVFYPTSAADRDDVTFLNPYIDFNGTNNSCGGTCYYNNIGIGISHGVRFTIDGGTFLRNPGSQNIAVNGIAGVSGAVSGASIRNTVHTDACDIVNAACTDHTSIFVAASNYTISNNRCRNTTQSVKSTCWEQHGDRGTSYGNVVTKYNKFFNIAAITVVSSTFATNQLVVGNSGDACFGGQLWFDNTAGPLSDVLITGNQFTQNSCSVSGNFHEWNSSITAAGAKRLVYRDNTFNSLVAAAGAGTSCALILGRSADQFVENNVWENGLGPAICNGTFAATTSFKVDGNDIVDAGQTSTAGSRRGILINSGTTVAYASINRNDVRNVASSYMTSCLDVTLNTASESTVFGNNLNCTASATLVLTGSFITYPSAGVAYIRTPAGPLGATANGLDNQILQGHTGAAPDFLTVGTGCLTFLATPSSANLRACVTDETGTGVLYFVGGALGSPSSVGTMPAFTLGGNISGGAFQINNIVIGATTPLAGTFSTVATTGSLTVGTTNGTLQLNDTGGAAANQWVLSATGNANFNFANSTDGINWFQIAKVTGQVIINSSQAATSASTGAIKTSGGAGIGGALWTGTYAATGVVTVAGLPACGAGLKAARYFVSDANATFTAGIGAVVAGGGANNVPVTCDGTSWRIGANDNVPAALRSKAA